MNRRPAYILTAALLAVSLAASFYAWQLTDAGVARERHARFVREVNEVRLALQERLRVHLEALHALRALYARGVVDGATWATFCRTLALESRFPGLHRLSFNRRLTRDQVPAFEAGLRADPGNAALAGRSPIVRPIPHEGDAAPADELFVIEHCWPLTGDLPIGVDVYADPVRRDVIDRLRDGHAPLATPRVTFYPTGFCFVVMMNVATSRTAGGRDGVLAAVYLPDELIAHALATTALSPGITISVYDGAQPVPASRLFTSASAQDPAADLHETQLLDVAGRPWTLAAMANPDFGGRATARWLPTFVLGASVCTGLALAAMLFVLATAHGRARALANDMTAALEEQRALQLRSDRLRSLGEMAAGMAHELNQPLQGVRGQAEHAALAMARGWTIAPERLLGMMQAIIAQADRMTHIIDHVRLFAREAGRPQVTMVDIGQVAASAIGMIGAQIRAKGIDLELVPAAAPLPAVRCNAFSLEEVVLNLLTNARDAVEERLRAAPDLPGPHVTVRLAAVSTMDRETRVQLRVEDRGCGMPAAVVARAFEPFFTTKGPDRGTGLGLSIARALVEEVGGSITLDSDAAGTTVTIEFPAARPPETSG